MAEVFENFSKKVVDITNKAKTKAKGFYDVTKLKVDLKTKEVDLDECLEKLGRAYFVQVKKEIDNSEKINALLLEAEQLYADVASLKNSIAEAQNKKVCEHCSSLFDANQPYCQNCGQKVVAENKNQSE